MKPAFLAVVIVAGMTFAAWGRLDGSTAPIVETAYAGSLNNLHSFENIDCEFVITKGFAINATDFSSAMKAEIVSPIRTKARWVKRGRIERLQILTDDESKENLLKGPTPHPTRKGLGTVTLNFSGIDSLDNGEIELIYSPELENAILYPAEFASKPREELHPFRFIFHKVGGFGWCVDQWRKGLLTLKKADLVKRDDRQIFVVEFATSAAQDLGFEIDAGNGFLPMKSSLSSNTDDPSVLAILDTAKCSRARFFPALVRWAIRDGKSSGQYRIKQLQVTRLEVDKSPADSDLFVELLPGTKVSRATSQAAPFVTRTIEKVGPADLQTLWDMSERAENTPLMDTGVARASKWQWIAVTLAVVLLAGFAFYRWGRNHATNGMDTG